MAPRPVQRQQKSLAPLVVAVAVVAAGVCGWLGAPSIPVLLAGFVAAAWMEPPTVLTGKKDSSGFATPAHAGEQANLARSRFWRELKWRLFAPSGDWLPGRPPRLSWLAAVGGAATAAHLPVTDQAFTAANALAAFATIVTVAGARRRNLVLDDEAPATSLSDLRSYANRSTTALGIIAGVAGAAGTALAATAMPTMSWVGNGGSESPTIYAPLGPIGMVVVTAATAALLAVLPRCSRNALEHWRDVVAARSEWAPRWDALKQDPAPRLTDRQRVGPATVDTFDAPSSAGAMAFWQLAGKVAPTLGPGFRVAILDTPNEDSNGPIPGTRHPLRFEVVVWPSGELPDPTDPSTPVETIELFARCATVWALDTVGYARPVLLSTTPITDQSPVAAWMTTWAWPDGPSLTEVRSLVGDLSAAFGCDVIIDSRGAGAEPAMYFGGMLDPDVEFAPRTHNGQPVATDYPTLMENLSVEDHWDSIWAQVSKQGTNPPTVQHAVRSTTELGDGTVINRQAFVTRTGIDPSEYRGLEPKLATALSAAPFVCVTGWTTSGTGRRGERHPQAFVVYWANSAVPATPDRLASSPAAINVLAGHVNAAFDAAKLARPEIVNATSLTTKRSSRHLWQISLRLYGGVTLADVRSRANRLRSAFGAQWLRVAATDDGCDLYVGGEPEDVDLARPKQDLPRLIALDWEQAFADSGVTGNSGLLPELVGTDHLPRNEQVQVLDFRLPPGLDHSTVKASIGKLRTATGNDFIDARPGANASEIRLLVSEVNPLPTMVGYDFVEIDRSDGIPFATGVDGEPVVFRPDAAPHALLAGKTGAGKAQSLDSRLPVPVSERFPSGWATIGELALGDSVFAADGSVTKVVGLSPIVTQEVYRLHLSDGQIVECGPEHLWKVSTAASRRAWRPGRTMRRRVADSALRREAARLRSLRETIPQGSVASISEIERVSGVNRKAIRSVLNPEMGSPVVVSSGAAGTSQMVVAYPVDETLGLLAERCDQRLARAPMPQQAILTAAEIADHVRAGRGSRGGGRDLAIRVSGPVELPEIDLPMDPYLLGAWLGDGTAKSGTITSGTDAATEMAELLSAVWPHGVQSQPRGHRYSITLRRDDSRCLYGHPVQDFVVVKRGGDRTQRRCGVCQKQYVRAWAQGESPLGVMTNPSFVHLLRRLGVHRNKHIPPEYLRASEAQRLSLLQGLMDTDGTISARDGWCRFDQSDERLAKQVLELVRSLGIKASISSRSAGYRNGAGETVKCRKSWRVEFRTSKPVFRLSAKAGRLPSELGPTSEWLYIADVIVADPTEMRCISVDHPEHLYLTDGFVPTHNSVLAQVFVYGALVHNFETYIIDPVKGGADFVFARPYAKGFATTAHEAAATMKHIYNEVVRRKDLNAAAGVGSYTELDDPPPHLVVFIDEFTSLMGKSFVPKSDDPDLAAEIEAIVSENAARDQVGMLAGKIAREARSAGVTLLLGTQKLSAKMLDTIPGASDLKLLTLDSRLPVPISERFPDGWARNRDLVEGDLLYTPKGTTAPILGFSPVTVGGTVYEVEFSDGRVVKTGPGHWWLASDAESRARHGRWKERSGTRRLAIAERACEAADVLPVGTHLSPSELAKIVGYADPARIVHHAKDLGCDRKIRSGDGTLIEYDRDLRRGAPPRRFLADDAARVLAGTRSWSDFEPINECADKWLTAREIGELVTGGRVSARTAGNIGTLLVRAGCESKTGEPEPYLLDAIGFLRALAAKLRDQVGADAETGAPLALERLVTTEEMRHSLSVRGGTRANWAVRAAAPIDGPDVDLPVDPYVLGAWLGDGSTGAGVFTQGTAEGCTDESGLTDQAHLLEQLYAAGYNARVLPCHQNLIGTRGLLVPLRRLGVLHDKHIPAAYLRSSAAQRLALLQGLMDTDGSVMASGTCSLPQVSERIHEGALELIESLGFKASVSGWDAAYIPEGATEKKVTGWVHHISFSPNLPVFRLPRKLAKQRQSSDRFDVTRWRYVRSIREIESEPVRCIGIDDPDHLYLVEGFIPTHNTNMARTLLGKASFGDRASALASFEDAPVLEGDIPKGRGLWEPLTGSAEIIQAWFAPQPELETQLASRLDPLDVADQLVFDAPPAPSAGRPSSAAAPVVVDVGEFTFTLDDLPDLDANEEHEPESVDWGAATPPPYTGPVPNKEP